MTYALCDQVMQRKVYVYSLCITLSLPPIYLVEVLGRQLEPLNISGWLLYALQIRPEV